MARVMSAGAYRSGSGRPWRKLVLGAVLLLAVLVLADALVGRYQQGVIEQRKAAQARLERMAWFELRADLDDIRYTPDGRYRVTLWMENLFPEHELYLMLPAVRGFIQVGPQWKEVKTSEVTPEPALREGTVIGLKDRVKVSWVMDIPDKDYFELLPGYMHVQIHNDMFVSDRPEPEAGAGQGIVERSDYYYVHLKPIGADEERLRRINRFPAGAPVFIPMPPH